MAAKFVLKKGSTGKFCFNLVAPNGQVIATSEADESKATAIKASSRSSATPSTLRSTTRPTSSLLCPRRLHQPCRARPTDRSLVAEDRSTEGLRDQTGPEPPVHGACTRSRQVGESNGNERSPKVARSRMSTRQPSHDLVALWETGQSSSLPMRS